MKNLQKQNGFTLIEIAIVLVIIGLLLGGVLKGQEMITQAKIRNVANDFNGVSAAYYSYQDRYRAIPGDDPTAGGTTGRWTSSVSGSGDGQIDGRYADVPADTDPTSTEESNLFWQHLRLAGFVPGPTSGAGSGNDPQNAAGGVTGVQNGALGIPGLVICSSNLPAKIASAIDSQFDNGNATTGQVRGMLQKGSNDAVTTTEPTTNYVDNGTNLYVVCKNL